MLCSVLHAAAHRSPAEVGVEDVYGTYHIHGNKQTNNRHLANMHMVSHLLNSASKVSPTMRLALFSGTSGRSASASFSQFHLGRGTCGTVLVIVDNYAPVCNSCAMRFGRLPRGKAGGGGAIAQPNCGELGF